MRLRDFSKLEKIEANFIECIYNDETETFHTLENEIEKYFCLDLINL